jgi:hypothetical protein
MFERFKELIADAPDDAMDATWRRRRRLPRECDQALTGTTRNWLKQLPSRQRPLRLCTEYPRVANRIAWCWRDAALSESVLGDLLVDRRGGRLGFPTVVLRELQLLQAFNLRHRVEDRPERLWERVARIAGRT